MEKNREPNRRGFFHKLVGLAALGSLSSLILSHKVDKGWALAGTGTAGQIAFWSGSDTITGSDNLKWDETNRNFIAGCNVNTVTTGAYGATISGGGETPYPNKVTDIYGTVGGGYNNQAGDNTGTINSAAFATVAGGESNIASKTRSTVGGGSINTASGDWSTIGGGSGNTASNSYATIAGGFSGAASGIYSTIGGGRVNAASASDSTVSGGQENTASGLGSAVGGGYDNTANAQYSTVAGGASNAATGNQSAICGGAYNYAGGSYSTIGGGQGNDAIGNWSTVGGGEFNEAHGLQSIIGGGYENRAGNQFATVSGGYANSASGYSSAIVGGANNQAAGDYSLAAGNRAKINAAHGGAFLFSDANPYDFNSAAAHEFAIRCTGGARFVTGIDGSGNPTQTIAMNTSGCLGIGTTSPVAAVHVKSSLSNPAIRLENENAFVGEFIYCYSSGSHIPFFSGRRARGTTASPTAVQTDDILMRYGGSGYGTTAFPGGNRAILEFRAAEAWTDAAQGTYITMQTTPTGSTGTAERIRITAAGEIIPPTDNTGSIGTASKRWSLIRGVTIQPGDLLFENGYRLTEDQESGMLLKNQKGTTIAKFDEQGNLHIKGKFMEDLKS